MTKKQLRIESRFETLELNFVPRFNIAPTQECTVVRVVGGKLEASQMIWGFRPAWSKAPIINAQAESLHEKAIFSAAIRSRRCLVPADAFYEWRGSRTEKRPMRIGLQSEEPFYFAGLWAEPSDQSAGRETFVLLTTAANSFMATIHSRMPLILGLSECDRWLDATDSDIGALLGEPAGLELKAVEVCSRVNNVRNDDEDCLSPPEQRDLF